MNQGFIKLPRAFLQSKNWNDLNPRQKTVFLILLENAAYENRTFNSQGETIELKAGEICISRERLHSLCPKGISPKQVRLSILFLTRKNLVSKRANKRANQTSVLSITDPIIYEECFKEKGQQKGQKKGQPREKKGPTKKEVLQKKDIKESNAGPSPNIFSFPIKKYGSHVLLSEAEYNQLFSVLGDFHLTHYINRVNDYLTKHPDKRCKNYSQTIQKWFTEDKDAKKLPSPRIIPATTQFAKSGESKPKFIANYLPAEDESAEIL